MHDGWILPPVNCEPVWTDLCYSLQHSLLFGKSLEAHSFRLWRTQIRGIVQMQSWVLMRLMKKMRMYEIIWKKTRVFTQVLFCVQVNKTFGTCSLTTCDVSSKEYEEVRGSYLCLEPVCVCVCVCAWTHAFQCGCDRVCFLCLCVRTYIVGV